MVVKSLQSIESIVCSAPSGVVSFVGGGGKTSLMFHLAHQLSRAGKRVLTTTTTKLFVPTPDQSQIVLINVDPEAILSQTPSRLHKSNHITAAAVYLVDSGKLQGFAPESIRIFQESGLFDWILVEADGAARRPLKAPAGHEPVVPSNTTVLVSVAGLEVLGKPLTEELVFRSELAVKLMGLALGEVITESALARLIAHPLGSFKGAPSQARRLIFLNKADSPERRDYGARVAEQLRRIEHPLAEVLIVGQALDGICIHAVHSLAVWT